MKHLLLLALLLSCSLSFAQKNKKNAPAPVAKPAVVADQAHAKNFLLKTNRFTGHTHRAVMNGKVYTGNLGQMVRYERYAKKMYEAGNYQQAMYFSKRARIYGHEALKANKAITTSDGKFTAEEETLTVDIPEDVDLEKILVEAGEPSLTDESLMAGNLGIDIK
jgi:hypothetical protein